MPYYPPILHCLICEEVRPEVGGKSTVLGLYGVAPDAELVLADFSKPLERLSFLLASELGSGTYRVSMRIDSPSGEAVVAPPEIEFSFPSAPQPIRFMNAIFAINGIQFQASGRHKFTLLVQGREHYQTYFEVSPASKP
jgi:hypothetical protein